MRTYVISDIHGWWEKFEKLLDFLTPEDIVYVLGDVIDRGQDGIKILQYIMEHPNQFRMVIGNHEKMMLNFLEYEKFAYSSFVDYIHLRTLYVQWALSNHGEVTLSAYEKLTQEEKEKIIKYLQNLPVAYQNVKVGESTFYLVHSSPPVNKLSKKEVIYQKDLKGNRINDYIWARHEHIKHYWCEDKIVIAGHTMVLHRHDDPTNRDIFISKDENEKIRYIDIDCGCALQNESSRLACLCLDDFSVTYF